jgi:hypothetical protein
LPETRLKADGEIRLPLQIGTSSIWSLARGSAALLGGPALTALAVENVIQTRSMIWLSLGAGIAGILFFFFGWSHLKYALMDRPSDVVLSGQGLRVEGGRHHGLAVAWPEIDRSLCTLLTEKERRLTALSIAGNAVMGTLAVAFETVPSDIEILRQEVEVLRLRVGRLDSARRRQRGTSFSSTARAARLSTADRPPRDGYAYVRSREG